jgi:hypothetical protein
MDVGKWVRLQWDRFGAWALIALGLGAVFFGWYGISDTPYAAEQLPFLLSGGVGGALLVGLGGVLWLSADLRDEWRKLDRIEQRLSGPGLAVEEAATAFTVPASTPAAGAAVENSVGVGR